MAAVQTSDQLALHRPNLSSNRFRTEPWGGLFCDFRTMEAIYLHLFIVLFSRERERGGFMDVSVTQGYHIVHGKGKRFSIRSCAETANLGLPRRRTGWIGGEKG